MCPAWFFPMVMAPKEATKQYGISRRGKESLQLPKQPHRLNNPLAIYDLHADSAIIALKRAGASDAFGYHHRHGQHPMTPPIASYLARTRTCRCTNLRINGPIYELVDPSASKWSDVRTSTIFLTRWLAQFSI